MLARRSPSAARHVGQLTKKSRQIQGIALGSEGSPQPFRLAISAPLQDKEGHAYYCWVSCPIVLRRRRKIFGANPKQASKLSIEFVCALLRDRYTILNRDGEALDLLAIVEESAVRTLNN
jgi:hypothetical protein